MMNWLYYSIFLLCSWQNNAFLARRLLNGELEPSKILNMTYSELKVCFLSGFLFLTKNSMELLSCQLMMKWLNLFRRFSTAIFWFKLVAMWPHSFHSCIIIQPSTLVSSIFCPFDLSLYPNKRSGYTSHLDFIEVMW